jgi:hypothetical protein
MASRVGFAGIESFLMFERTLESTTTGAWLEQKLEGANRVEDGDGVRS